MICLNLSFIKRLHLDKINESNNEQLDLVSKKIDDIETKFILTI